MTPNADLAAMKEEDTYPDKATWEELPFVPFPHTKDYELDLHRPYIDDVVLVDEKGSKYERVAEVLDCWVESGAMPFASMQYPRSISKVNPMRFFGLFPKGYPGDFIAEYIAQTRTWFYYMHAMGVLLFGRRAFKSVVSTGTILAADGSKMSKSKGNYTDPLELMDTWGADPFRFHLMSSVVMQGEDLNFRNEDVREAHNRVVGTLWNSFKFFELYKDKLIDVDYTKSKHPLDRWVVSLLNKTIKEVTVSFDAYDLPNACRPLRAFIDDYSTWYVRRSRDRARGDGLDAQMCLATQRHVLVSISKLLAPITPFLAESIWQGMDEEKSVHLSQWPTGGSVDEALLRNMQVAREIASAGLQAREKANMKVRQPLSKLTIQKELPHALRAIIADELNVKEVITDPTISEPAVLDTMLTPQLREEGTMRDIVRRIQAWRKEQNLQIGDKAPYSFVGTDEERAVARTRRDEIMELTGLSALNIE
jgi:isoleucyl-tRNA synthetase